jgi:hypothetical protein
MATPNIELISALRATVKKLESGATYHWGHMGACNCGNLAQELLQVSKAEIHAWALQTREGDWSEQTAEYCAKSNLPLDLMISKLLQKGLTTSDLQHLEKLSDPQILALLSAEERHLNFNNKVDLIKYLKAWSSLLENQFSENVSLASLYEEVSVK